MLTCVHACVRAYVYNLCACVVRACIVQNKLFFFFASNLGYLRRSPVDSLFNNADEKKAGS